MNNNSKIEIPFIKLPKLPRVPKKICKLAGLVLLAAVIFSSGYFSGLYFEKKAQSVSPSKNIYLNFIGEVYDKIQENYWDKISDKDLSLLFKAGMEKLSGAPESLGSENKRGVLQLVEKKMKNKTADKKKEFATQLADIVLANLKPFGISRLYTQKEEQSLSEKVNNIDPETDLYKILGLNENASQKDIEKTYKTKSTELSKENTPGSKEKISLLERAYQALSNLEKRKTYDSVGAEPSVTFKSIGTDIFYINIKRISPDILNEFPEAANSTAGKDSLNSLIMDLRSNIGGSVDVLPVFLGYFLGQNQPAFEFFHQGEYIPARTQQEKLASLAKFKKIVILINEETQSSAEIIASSLKRYNIGITLGTHTKGWGTIKRIFSLDSQIDPKEKYSVFLAHSITIRDDGQPTEGRGIDPVIKTTGSNWPKELASYFGQGSLVEAVKNLVK